jgi:hypothetical protein
MRLIILLLVSLQLALVPTAVFSAQTTVDDDSIRKPVPIKTSLLRLLACPKEFNGKVVFVSGYFIDLPDHRAIYPNKSFVEYKPYPNGLWVHINSDKVRFEPQGYEENFPNLDKKYVELVGKFSMKSHGTLGLWTSGAIEDVDFIRIVEKYPTVQ